MESIKLSAKTIGATLIGIVGALLLGIGMCLTMVWSHKVVGIIVGMIGIVVLLCLITSDSNLKNGEKRMNLQRMIKILKKIFKLPPIPAILISVPSFILVIYLLANTMDNTVISYADYAVAMVDEITKGNHIQERISVVRK